MRSDSLPSHALGALRPLDPLEGSLRPRLGKDVSVQWITLLTAAVHFTFTSTCQRLGVEPWAQWQDALTRLPATTAQRLGDLLPDHWQVARRTKTVTPSAG